MGWKLVLGSILVLYIPDKRPDFNILWTVNICISILHFIMAVCCLKVAQTSNQFNHNKSDSLFLTPLLRTTAGIQFMPSPSTRHTHELSGENSSMTNLGICSQSLTANIIFPKMRFQNNKSAFRAFKEFKLKAFACLAPGSPPEQWSGYLSSKYLVRGIITS